MKISFAVQITLLYISFVSGMSYLAYICLTNPNDLVRVDYYDAGQKHQRIIDSRQNAAELKLKPKITVTNEIVIDNPTKQDLAIKIYRPSDQNLDQTLSLSKKSLKLEKNRFQSGYYLAQFSWADQQKSYYWEQAIYIK